MMMFDRMHELMGLGSDETVKMPLVMIIVIGARWYVCFAKYGEKETAVFRDLSEFGKTTSILGTYQVLVGLEAILEWVTMNWAP